MSEVLTNWLMEYGYWAVFLGAMLEGETAAFLSGVAAHNKLISYPLAMLFAALGGVVSDNVLFLVGRYAGAQVLPRFQKHQNKIRRVQQLIQRHENWIIIGIRFAYGMRTVGPIIIGASKVNPLRFFVLNLLGGAIWGCVIVSIGYFVSSFVFTLPFHPHFSWLAIIVLMIVGVWWIRRGRC